MMKAVINLQQLKHKVKGTQMMKKLTNVHLQLNGFLQTKKAQAVNKRTNELSFRVKEGLNIRVSQNIKLVVDSAVGVLIDAEAALMRLTGTGSHVITIVVIIIVIIIIDTIIKETRGNRKETLS